MLHRIAPAAAVLIVLAACGVPDPALPPDPGPRPEQVEPQPEPPARDLAAYVLKLPLSPELTASGGEVSVIHLRNDQPLTHEKLKVAPGAETVSVFTTNQESLALTQSSGKVARSLTVEQPGCASPFEESGVVLRVPDDYATIQEAIDAASPGDTVQVGPGVYTEYLRMRPGVRLRGSGAANTVLDGQGQPRNLIDLTAAPGAVVSGFTFRGVPLAQLGCAQPDDPFECSGDWYAAAIYGDGHWQEYLDYAAVHPGLSADTVAPACSGAFAFITNNVFEQNYIGVMAYFHARFILYNNVFRENGVAFVGNHLQDRGALLNNTFWNNGQIAVGVSAGFVDVINNIVAGSGVGLRHEHIQRGQVACNLFWQNPAHEAVTYVGEDRWLTFGVDGNVEADPLFVDAANGDFHLGSGSAAIDTGCTAFNLADADGSPVDMGAYGGPLGDW